MQWNGILSVFCSILINANNHVTHTSMKIENITTIPESSIEQSLF